MWLMGFTPWELLLFLFKKICPQEPLGITFTKSEKALECSYNEQGKRNSASLHLTEEKIIQELFFKEFKVNQITSIYIFFS